MFAFRRTRWKQERGLLSVSVVRLVSSFPHRIAQRFDVLNVRLAFVLNVDGNRIVHWAVIRIGNGAGVSTFNVSLHIWRKKLTFMRWSIVIAIIKACEALYIVFCKTPWCQDWNTLQFYSINILLAWVFLDSGVLYWNNRLTMSLYSIISHKNF